MRPSKLIVSAGLSMVLAASPSWAQSPPFDCDSSASHRAFDFWLGQWEVQDPNGTVQGHNDIRKVQRGCALEEQWRSVRGGSGQSLNYYQPDRDQWRQVWIDGGASIIDISGGLDGESMVLEGTIEYLGTPGTQPFRGRWDPLPDGRVRQFFEQRDAGGTWQTWFEGFYTRQP